MPTDAPSGIKQLFNENNKVKKKHQYLHSESYVYSVLIYCT